MTIMLFLPCNQLSPIEPEEAFSLNASLKAVRKVARRKFLPQLRLFAYRRL